MNKTGKKTMSSGSSFQRLSFLIQWYSSMPQRFSLALIVSLLFLTGCPTTNDSKITQLDGGMTEEQLLELANRPLRVLCVGSSAWGDEMVSQYTGRFDNKIEIVSETLESYQKRTEAELNDFDVLIAPNYSLPVLAEERKLFEIRPENLERLNESSMLSVDRKLVRYGKKIYGVSLGVPLRCVFYNQPQAPDNWNAPFSWQQWHEEAVKSNAKELKYLEPMAGMGAAESLLLRGGAYARSRTQVSMYFDKNSAMTRINSAPFVSALTEMKEEYGKHVELLKSLRPTAAIELILQSKATAAICEIVNLESVETELVTTNKSWAVEALPYAHRYYNTFTKQWVDRSYDPANSFQLIGTEGRVACILKKSRKTESAMRLLTVLTNSPTAEAIAPFGTNIGPAKALQLDQMANWFGKEYPAEVLTKFRALYDLANDAQGSAVLFFPSTENHVERLESLNTAVLNVLAGEIEPQSALDQCAETWDKLSNADLPGTKSLLSNQ